MWLHNPLTRLGRPRVDFFLGHETRERCVRDRVRGGELLKLDALGYMLPVCPLFVTPHLGRMWFIKMGV